MNIALWVLQGLLAVAFGGAGLMKVTTPAEQLAAKVDLPARATRLIGAAELLGVLGLVLPGIFGTATVLTPLAATGLAVVAAGAVVYHRQRKEPFVPVAVLLVLALVVVVGRFGPYPL